MGQYQKSFFWNYGKRSKVSFDLFSWKNWKTIFHTFKFKFCKYLMLILTTQISLVDRNLINSSKLQDFKQANVFLIICYLCTTSIKQLSFRNLSKFLPIFHMKISSPDSALVYLSVFTLLTNVTLILWRCKVQRFIRTLTVKNLLG